MGQKLTSLCARRNNNNNNPLPTEAVKAIPTAAEVVPLEDTSDAASTTASAGQAAQSAPMEDAVAHAQKRAINYIEYGEYESLLQPQALQFWDGELLPRSPAVTPAQSDLNQAARAKRVQKEVQMMRKNLPAYATNAIYVRCEQDNLNHMHAIITGAEDTPYAFGCFLFDIGLPDAFPQSPPQMKILTTGDGAVRFNPNLYNCGYVCLSLLGTWSGESGENWDPATCSVMHVLMSIQSLVMHNDVLFCEPGYAHDAQRKDAHLLRCNIGYSNIVRYATVKYAMNGMIRDAPDQFREVVTAHFYLNKAKILANVEKWIQEAAAQIEAEEANRPKYEDLTQWHNSQLAARFAAAPTEYLDALKAEFEELKANLEAVTYFRLYCDLEFFKDAHLRKNDGRKMGHADMPAHEFKPAVPTLRALKKHGGKKRGARHAQHV